MWYFLRIKISFVYYEFLAVFPLRKSEHQWSDQSVILLALSTWRETHLICLHTKTPLLSSQQIQWYYSMLRYILMKILAYKTIAHVYVCVRVCTQNILYIYRAVCVCVCVYICMFVAWGEMEMTQITKNKWEQPTRIATLCMIRRILKERPWSWPWRTGPAVTAIKLTSATQRHTHADTHTYVHLHTHKRQAQLQIKEPPYKTRSIFKLDIMILFEDDLCLKICSTHIQAHTHPYTHLRIYRLLLCTSSLVAFAKTRVQPTCYVAPRPSPQTTSMLIAMTRRRLHFIEITGIITCKSRIISHVQHC